MSHLLTNARAKSAEFSILNFIIATLLSVALIIGFLAPVSSAYADESATTETASANDEGQSLTPMSGEVRTPDATIVSNHTLQGYPTPNLSAYVTYNPNFSKGDTVRFTYNVTGNTDNMMYYLYNFEVETSTGWNDLLDISKNNEYSTNNYIDEQIHLAGKYRLTFQVCEYRNETDGTKYFYYTGKNGTVSTRGGYVRFQVEFTIPELNTFESMDTIVAKVVEQCNEECKKRPDESEEEYKQESQYRKALWLNEWICANTEYDNSGKSCSAEGVFGRGLGTCEAYHDAYSMLLNKVGIETRRVESRGLNSEGKGDNHVWTGVKLNGKWYNVDTTWNDAVNYSEPPFDTRYLYFALPTDVMMLSRVAWDGTYVVESGPDSGKKYPFDANSYDDNYFIHTRKILDYIKSYKEDTSGPYSVKAMLSKKTRQFDLPIENKSWPDNYKNVIYPLAAYQLCQEPWGGNVSRLTATYSNDALHFNVRYINDVDVTFNANGGSFPATTITGPAGVKMSDYNWPTAVPTRNNYTFTGWNTVANGSGINFTKDDCFPGDAGNQITLYAQWKANPTSSGDNSGNTSTTNPGTTTTNPGTSAGDDSPGTIIPDPLTPPKGGSWVKTGGRWWYKYDDGMYPKSTTLRIDSAIYSFDGSGWMRKGWAQHSTGWYYHTSSGAATTGWVKSGGKWYFLDKNTCVMKTNSFYADGGANYYSNSSGVMQTGWTKVNGTWYLMSASGAMRFGWVKQGKTWYYLTPGTGKMATGMFDVGSKTFFANSSGAMRTGWVQHGDQWFYFTSSGAMATNKWISGTYWVGVNGVMATNEWVDNGRYYVNSSGVWVRNAKK